jgi:uncharacterized protein (TIGR00299 family) protein
MKTAYFDCFSGVSGDMILGALVDAGLALEDLKKNLSGLAVKGYTLKARTVHKGDLRATKVDVLIAPAAQKRLKAFGDLEKIIQRSHIAEPIRQKGLKVLKRLIQAEAKVHGVLLGRLKLHGMNPVDTLVDIMGAVVGLHLLGVQRIISSPIHVGGGLKGFSAATAELLKGIPLYSSGIAQELATPTGVAILATLSEDFSPTPPLTLHTIGYGAGVRELAQGPNLLRILIGESLAFHHPYEMDQVIQLETNIDDLSPQIYEHLMERMLAAGALDVYFTPIVMKKGRPATQVSVLATHIHVDNLLKLLFQETTTLGIRIREVVRAKLPRMERTVQTSFGRIRVKITERGIGKPDVVPEYRDCKEIAHRTGLPLRTVVDQIKADVRHAVRSLKREP